MTISKYPQKEFQIFLPRNLCMHLRKEMLLQICPEQWIRGTLQEKNFMAGAKDGLAAKEQRVEELAVQ